MYLEWFFKEKAAGEKSLEEVVVDLLAERKQQNLVQVD